MEPGDSFFALSNFVRGKIDKYTLQYSDPLIDGVSINKDNLAQSYVYLDFKDDEKFLKTLNISDDDIWFARVIDSPYNNFEFFDSYNAEEDFTNGYGVWYVLNEENIELLEKISKFLYPGEFDLDDESFKKGLAEKLMKYYPREIDNILSDYTNERNSEMQQDARESIHKEINEFLNGFGFEFVSYDKIKAKVGDLISLYYQYNVPHLSLSKMLKEVFKDQDSNLGGWDENRYEYGRDEYFDEESVNREINRNFEKIYDALVEGYEDDNEWKKFFKFAEEITKKYKIGVWYDLPKDNSIIFKIDAFDNEAKKIVISLKKRKSSSYSTPVKIIKVSQDAFYKLLYQPELFNLVDL